MSNKFLDIPENLKKENLPHKHKKSKSEQYQSLINRVVKKLAKKQISVLCQSESYRS